MEGNTSTAGATPVVTGATPVQTTPDSPATTTSLTTPAATTAATVTTTAATADGDEPLGAGGAKALDAERAARKAAEKAAKDAARRIEELENATKSDTEKAIAQARREGETAIRERFQARLRNAEVRNALGNAGANADLIDLVARSDEFTALAVSDDGDVDADELRKAVEAIKSRLPAVFAAPAAAPAPGTADGGVRTGTTPAKSLSEAIEQHYRT